VRSSMQMQGVLQLCCSMLKCVAACDTVLPSCVAVVLQLCCRVVCIRWIMCVTKCRRKVCCSCVAVVVHLCCRVVHLCCSCVAVVLQLCCSMLQCGAFVLKYVTVVLQCVTVCCSVLQRVADPID